jgi:hypothetical protein
LKALLTFMVGIIFAPPATGQQPKCAPLENMSRARSAQYSEHSVGLGLIENGNVLQRFESEGGRSWTIIVVRPSGMSCVWLVGESWARVLPPKKGQEG